MAGNARRPGATRKGGSKKGPLVGTGGQQRRSLQGRGPTPKAEDRPHHRAHKSVAGNAGSAASADRARRARRAGAPELVSGRNVVLESLRAGVPATTLYVASRVEVDDRVREALRLAAQAGLPVLETPRGEMDRLADGTSHQGLALAVPAYQYADPRDLTDPELPGTPLIVALDGVTDPRNLGAVLRSVAAFGGHGVVVPERRSAGMTAAAWRTSAGAAARVPVARATNLTRALQQFQEAGYFVVGLAADGAAPVGELAVADRPLVVVAGSEGKGLSRLVRETCDQVCSIPMAGGMESLNVSVAAGVALYEVARLRAAGRG